MTTFLSLISGAIGGNIGAGVFRSLNLGLAGNTVAGLAGGALGGLAVAEMIPSTYDLSALMGTMIGSGAAGAVLVWAGGLLRRLIRRP